MKVNIVQGASEVVNVKPRGLEGVKPTGPSDGGAPKQAPKPKPNSTGDVAYRLSVSPDKPPQPVVTNPETGKTKPLIPDNPGTEWAVERQIQNARNIVATPPPQSPVPQLVNVTV